MYYQKALEYMSNDIGFESEFLRDGFRTHFFINEPVTQRSLFDNVFFTHYIGSKINYLPAFLIQNIGFAKLVDKVYKECLEPYALISDDEEVVVKARWAVNVNSYKKITGYDFNIVRQYDDAENGISLVFYSTSRDTKSDDAYKLVYLCFDFIEHERARVLRKLS